MVKKQREDTRKFSYCLEMKICSGLCSKIDENDYAKCNELCRSLMSDTGRIDEICPFEKNCPAGCPCPFYECENIDNRKLNFAWYYNATDPLFQLKNDTVTTISALEKLKNAMKTPFDPFEEDIQHLSRLVSFNITSLRSEQVFERLIYHESRFVEPDFRFLAFSPVNITPIIICTFKLLRIKAIIFVKQTHTWRWILKNCGQYLLNLWVVPRRGPSRNPTSSAFSKQSFIEEIIIFSMSVFVHMCWNLTLPNFRI